jgi:glutathione S-transferase
MAAFAAALAGSGSSAGGSGPEIILYTSASCPFGRRGWMALLEKGLDAQIVRIPLSGELRGYQEGTPAALALMNAGYPGKTLADVLTVKQSFQQNVNPSGEVPAVSVGGDIVAEADVVAEFLDDRFPDAGLRLMPQDALSRARVRHYCKLLGGGSGVSAMYGLLRNQDPAKDAALRDKVYAGLKAFADMASDDGPWFLGERLSFPDIMLAPMFDQFRFLLPHYRGVEFIPQSADGDDAPCWVARMRTWAAAVEQRPSFVKLSRGKDAYVAGYAGYAGARGVSELGA